MCRVLQVARSGFYSWLHRSPSKRAREDLRLVAEVQAAYRRGRKAYGSPRVRRELRKVGFFLSRKRVARLMKHMGLIGRPPRRFYVTTESGHGFPIAENLVQRNFNVDSPDKLWGADITYAWTGQGWLYLAVVMDMYSRRIVGWSIADHMRVELVLDALEMALSQRCPGSGLVHHSDRGIQFASTSYRRVLKEHDISCSMSRKRDPWDNATVESFFSTLKNELENFGMWPTKREAKSAIIEYIQVFYNSQRMHSYLGYLSPVEYERMHPDRRAA